MRVVIGEDEALLRQGLVMLLGANDMEIVGAAGDAVELLDLVDRTAPDLVVTDIRMPPGNTDDGLQAALRLRERADPVPVMVLSQFVERRYAEDLLRPGPEGIGYQLKQRIADVEHFCADLRTVAAGGTCLDPEVIGRMVDQAARRNTGLDALTARQRSVLALVAEGRSNTAIAADLHISEKAVVQHTSHIYDQLGLPRHGDHHRRVLAVIQYLTESVPAGTDGQPADLGRRSG